MGWLVAAVVLVALSLVVFAGGLRGRAVAVTVVEDAVVGWLAGLEVPGLLPVMRGMAGLGFWMAMNVWLWGLLAALLVLRRFRQLLVVLLAWIVQGVMIQFVLAPLVARPRPFLHPAADHGHRRPADDVSPEREPHCIPHRPSTPTQRCSYSAIVEAPASISMNRPSPATDGLLVTLLHDHPVGAGCVMG